VSHPARQHVLCVVSRPYRARSGAASSSPRSSYPELPVGNTTPAASPVTSVQFSLPTTHARRAGLRSAHPPRAISTRPLRRYTTTARR